MIPDRSRPRLATTTIGALPRQAPVETGLLLVKERLEEGGLVETKSLNVGTTNWKSAFDTIDHSI